MTDSLIDDKNFRLNSETRPRRYVAKLEIDLKGRAFSGEATIDLQSDTSANTLVIHAHQLEILEGKATSTSGQSIPMVKVERFHLSQTVRLHFAEILPAGPLSLTLRWGGKFSGGLRGLYWAGTLAATQFEAADARRVFPCFDEPAFKCTWKLTLDVPADAQALSNGAIEFERNTGPGRKDISFVETPPLSSYLVAFAVGEMVSTPEVRVGNVPIRTWAGPEKIRLAAFAQEVASNVLPRLEQYFGMPYAFGKLDQLGVPDFEAGAMENAGLITFRELALLLDPETASLNVKKRVAEVITHELAHQWFGNWVTMAWWDDLWLNEAFATWMAYKIVDGWRPEWRVWLDFGSGKATALHLDALRSTHSIRAEVKNVDEAGESFDAITYEKGGAVLRMIEGFLGEEPFREGIRAYMKKHGQGNAVADDLWRALEGASEQPVLHLANAWIRQSGYPRVEVELEPQRGTVQLSQKRFFSEPAAQEMGPAQVWPVPMVLRFEDESGVREQRLLLRDQSETVNLEPQGTIRWLCANAFATGFYRVAYSSRELDGLSLHLQALRPEERTELLADQWALLRANAPGTGVENFLNLFARFSGETDPAVLDELVARLSVIEHRLLDEVERPYFERFVGSLLGGQLSALGWDAAPGESDATRLRRAAVVRAMGLLGRSPEVAKEARLRLEKFWRGQSGALDANLNDAAVVMFARDGSLVDFDQLLARFQNESDPAFKRRYLAGLAAFESPLLSGRILNMAFEDTVPMQDFPTFVAVLLGNRMVRLQFWEALRNRWAEVTKRAGNAPMLLRRVVEAIGQLTERAQLDEAKAFFAANPLESARQATAQTLERMEQDVVLRDRLRSGVAQWLRSQQIT